MVLIVGRETIKSRVYYHISFELDSRLFMLREGIENPEIALKLFRDLQKKDICPVISRTICYKTDNSGFLTKDPERETLNIERLEEIVGTKETNPSFTKPIVEYSHWLRGIDIGD